MSISIRNMTEEECRKECLEREYTFEKKEDGEGKTRGGWWKDDVYLAKAAKDALRMADGHG